MAMGILRRMDILSNRQLIDSAVISTLFPSTVSLYRYQLKPNCPDRVKMSRSFLGSFHLGSILVVPKGPTGVAFLPDSPRFPSPGGPEIRVADASDAVNIGVKLSLKDINPADIQLVTKESGWQLQWAKGAAKFGCEIVPQRPVDLSKTVRENLANQLVVKAVRK